MNGKRSSHPRNTRFYGKRGPRLRLRENMRSQKKRECIRAARAETFYFLPMQNSIRGPDGPALPTPQTESTFNCGKIRQKGCTGSKLYAKNAVHTWGMYLSTGPGIKAERAIA